MDRIDYIVNKINKERNDRTLVLWGGWEGDKKLREKLLEKLNIEEGFYVTVDLKVIGKRENDKEIVHISKIDGKASEYYIVAFPKQTTESDAMFLKYGFGKNDVAYIHHGAVVVTKGGYEDEFGNIVSILPPNVKVIMEGYNNHISLGKVTVNESLTIYCTGNAILNIEDDVAFKEEFKISLLDMTGEADLFPRVHISTGCKFLLGRMSCFSGDINFERETTFGKNLIVNCACGMKIEVGKKSMFSSDVVFLSGDGHLIFDCNTKECINSYKKLSEEKRKVKIGEHVWGGLRTMYLNGAKIGNGSVIGAYSVVKKTFPNNVVVAGSPAKIIRKNIAWGRQAVNEDIELCGEEYIKFTEEELD